jgi:TRAP-type C4-dicarboxylate transport system permease small subunit
MNTAPGRPNNPRDIHTGSRLMRLLDILHRAEDLLIALLLTATMALALFQIVQRNIMGTGLLWGDILIRIMVLWLGMAGAMAAARERKHIRIDLLTHFLTPGLRQATESLSALFAAGVCLIAGYVSLQFVRSEYAAGDLAFGNVPYWLCETVLPLGFTVIALRYGIQFVLCARGRSMDRG